MCTIRHFAIALALTMIPEEMQTAFMILRQDVAGNTNPVSGICNLQPETVCHVWRS